MTFRPNSSGGIEFRAEFMVLFLYFFISNVFTKPQSNGLNICWVMLRDVEKPCCVKRLQHFENKRNVEKMLRQREICPGLNETTENYKNCEKSKSYEKKSKCGAREVLAKTANLTKFTKITNFTKIAKNRKVTRKTPNVMSERSWRNLWILQR